MSLVQRCRLSAAPFSRRKYHSQFRAVHSSPLLSQLSKSPRPPAISHVYSFPSLTPTLPIMASQTRAHSGFGAHDRHSHHHGSNMYLTSTNKHDAGVRITRIGLAVNLAMAIGKFIGGYVFHSQALIADAYHALTDLVSDILTLGTVAWSLKPPTYRFPGGYGKVESIGALGVSGLLLFGGVFMGLNASHIILDQFFPGAAETIAHLGIPGLGHGHGHSHAHGAGALGPNINAAWLAGGSVVVKEWLYRATMKVARERKSSVLASNAVHHRIDSLTSIVALLTIGGTHVFNDASWLDPVGGLLISLMVIRAGWENTHTSLLELADTTVDDDIKASVRNAATRVLADIPDGGNIGVRSVQGMKSGQNYLMDIELAVPGNWTVNRSHEVEEAIRAGIGMNVRGVRRLKVRFVPAGHEGILFDDEFIAPEPDSESLEPEEQEHDHDHSHDHDQADSYKEK